MPSYTYKSLVEGWGYHIVAWASCGSYQGQVGAILQDGDRYAFWSHGYGSCSGCDILESLERWDWDSEVEETSLEKAQPEQYAYGQKEKALLKFIFSSYQEVVSWVQKHVIEDPWYADGNGNIYETLLNVLGEPVPENPTLDDSYDE